MKLIDITNINKVQLLEALWNSSKSSAFHNAYGGCVFDKVKAQSVVNSYIDYFCGRVIKSDLSGNTVDARLYDRDNGNGKFLKVVNSLKCPLEVIYI